MLKSLELLSAYDVVVLGDREFCSTKLGNWLAERKVYFVLMQSLMGETPKTALHRLFTAKM
ncbi:hypothetical protein BJP36_09105 [Moorena producens JHB]|uniref:Transposase IS4-like domain-containing protein n=1 Tax=Moorena producens (strain JHB) TaxID=1454205 RepID=A0A1D9FXK9_MOOP1|nr:hypothetical protein [Moorena producens]AOY80063.1 hypothetical protein BJP36_09105 [Moorena producens JHB]